MHLVPFAPPNTARQACYLCGQAEDRKAPREQILTDVVIDYEGHLCICVVCAGVMAGMIGYASPAEHTVLQQELADAQADACGAEERVEELEALVAAQKLIIESFGEKKMLAAVGAE